MIYLALSVLSSVAIGIIIHFSEKKKLHRTTVMAANYWMAAFLGFWLSHFDSFSFSSVEIALAVLGGVTFVLGFLAIMISIHKKGLAIPVTLMRLSVIYPVLFSILFWDESLSLTISLALLLSLAAIFLFTVRENVQETIQHIKDNWVPIIMLITIIGFADTITRALEYYGQKDRFESYLLILFGTAALVTTFILIFEKRKLSIQALVAGLLLGIPNYFTSHFILRALTQLQAVVVFPVFNLGVILLSVLFAMLVLKEKLTYFEKWGILIAIPAIILLQFS